MNILKEKNLKKDISFALSNFALVFTYSLCCAAALGQGLSAVVFISVACFVTSVMLKNKVLCPNPLLLVPLIFVFSKDNTVLGMLSLFSGGILYVLLRKFLSKIHISEALFRSFKIALALCATVLFTNIYFGIGAQGNTPVKMLSSYISLGFHPHFTGLLTGTITLFMMITYPFKFKRLNRYLPAEFISLAVPFLINLFLNPCRELTLINETNFFTTLSLADILGCFTLNIDGSDLLIKLLSGTLVFLFTFFILFSQKDNKETFLCGAAQISIAALPCIPVNTKAVRGASPRSVLISAVLSIAVCIAFPPLLSRLPLHSVGALLIVSSWQEAIKKEEG